MVPKGLPQPTANIFDLEKQFATACKDKKCVLSGISGSVNASELPTSTLYAQFQAASALVPCNENAISVFIPRTLLNSYSNPHDRYSVAVIYSDTSSKHHIKKWLK